MKLKTFVIFILLSICSISAYAEDKFSVHILNEISYQQAKNHPKQWEVSIHTYTTDFGSVTKYFLPAQNIKNNSSLIIEKQKKSPYPWLVKINGHNYYAEFDDDYKLKVGDKGVVKYIGDRLYFFKE